MLEALVLLWAPALESGSKVDPTRNRKTFQLAFDCSHSSGRSEYGKALLENTLQEAAGK